MLAALRHFVLREGSGRTYCVALSGGLDSSVLLALMTTLRQEIPFDLRAIHINHQISPRAAEWAAHCEAVCQMYDVPCDIFNVTLSLTSGESLEEKARELRYRAFAESLPHEAILVTAHHQDDQAETVLLQLLRGAGLKGLAAMPVLKPFTHGWLARPLLSFTRSQLEIYANENKLQWIEDESNTNTHLSRNFLRHQVMPLLQSHYQSALTTLTRTAQHCQEAQDLLDDYAFELYQQVKYADSNALSVAKLMPLTPAKQRLVLRYWIALSGFQLPSTVKLDTILHAVLPAKWDATPMVVWGNVELRRYRDALYLMSPLPAHDGQYCIDWDMRDALFIEGVGTVHAKPARSKGLKLDAQKVQVRFRSGGEKVYLNGMHQTLKNLMQVWEIPPWLRDRIPLLAIKENIIAIPGYYLNERYVVSGADGGLQFIWDAVK